MVKLIGSRLIEGQPITDTRIGLGEKVLQVTAGTAAAVGSVAGLAISAPVAVVDPDTRRNFADKTEAVGQAFARRRGRRDDGLIPQRTGTSPARGSWIGQPFCRALRSFDIA